ncbi:MAG: DUF952 domain-containing protein [Pseudomonadota bacterium]
MTVHLIATGRKACFKLSMTDTPFVYKILSSDDWAAAQSSGVTRTALDEGDGYVHLSTRAQVGDTLRLHYAGAADVHLLEFALDGLGDVRFEPSRGGDLFPHLYGSLEIALARRQWLLALDADGLPALPGDL